MYKKKDGTKITWKQFFQEWKKGISLITPVQKLTNDMRSTFTMLVGYIVGLISLIVYRKSFVVEWFTYALIIIFLGASWGQFIKWWALKQQLKLFNEFNSSAVDLNKVFDSLEEIEEEVPKPEGEELENTQKSEENIELKGGEIKDENNI
jgi:hypothetical protein